MPTVYLSTNTKRYNSTSLSSAMLTGGYDCIFKNRVDYRNPTILLKETSDISAYNVMKISGFYYDIISNVRVSDELVEITGRVRPQATLKDEIEACECFIEYAADATYNEWLPDERLPMTSDINVNVESSQIFSNTEGSIIISTASYVPNASVGFTSYYAMGDSAVSALSTYLYNLNGSALDDFVKKFKDVFGGIISCHWVPFTVSGTAVTVKVGDDAISGVSGLGLSYAKKKAPTTYTLSIPWEYEDWRDMPPYSTMTLYLPMYGEVTLDQSKFKGSTNLYVDVLADPIGGELCYHVYAGTQFRADYKVNVAVPLAIGQNQGNSLTGGIQTALGGLQVVGGIIGTATGAGAPAAALIPSGISTVINGAKTMFTESNSAKGGSGGFGTGNMCLQGSHNSIILSLTSHKFACDPTDYAATHGIPFMQFDTVGNHSGYVKCSGASVECNGYANSSDVAAVNAMLNGEGMFIE